MILMKKALSCILTAALSFSLLSCGFGNDSSGHREVDWEEKGHLVLALRDGTYADVKANVMCK